VFVLHLFQFAKQTNTTTNSVISAGHITAEIRTTGSDDPSLPVLGSDNQKIIGGARTGSDDNYHCRFVPPAGSDDNSTYHCRFKPRTDSDLILSVSVLG
jgi:hypothetical protein